MNNNIAIKVQNLTKTYHLYNKPQDRLKEALNPFKKSYHHDFYALNNVNFEIKKGETIGIIGKNGAGKSTLLKIITGVLTPTSGTVEINGKTASLLELGAGFNPEMTGLENIYLNGTIMGLTKDDIDKKIDTILDFADIGEFIYQQVKTYSSGMFARLAFSVSINIDPDILIIDEALSVGDMAFQLKCLRKMQDFSARNKTILFVSHDTGILNKFCTKAILLEAGTISLFSDVDDTINYYKQTISNKKYSKKLNNLENKNSSIDFKKLSSELESFGDNKIQISEISSKTILNTLKIDLKIKSHTNIIDPIIGITIKDRLNNIVFQTNTFDLNILSLNLRKNSIYIITFEVNLPPLNSGKYSISPAVASGIQSSHTIHHWIYDASFFDVDAGNHNNLEGFLYMKNTIKVAYHEE